MYKITYYIGCNDKDTLKQELSYNDFITVFDSVFTNYTLQEGRGVFVNANDERTFENSFIVTTFNDEVVEVQEKIIKSRCQQLKELLNQECILVTKELIQASFI